MNKITITIELGNEAMQTFDDVARLLRWTAYRLSTSEDGSSFPLYDENGNKVGALVTTKS